MASGTITGSTSNKYIDSKIEWSSVKNTASNSSDVTAKLYYKRNNSGYTTSGTGSFSITINGTKKTASSVTLNIGTSWVLAMTATVTVQHNSDGSKSIAISATGSLPPTSLTSTTCGGTAKLDTIARASTITSAGNVTLGNACNVKWTPLSASFRYKLKFSLGSWSHTTGAIHPNKTSAYTYSGYPIPLDVAYQILSGYTGKMTVTLYTFSNSGATTQVGSDDSETFTVTVPSTTKPTVSMSLSPVHSLPEEFDGIYVQGLSKVKADLSADTEYNAKVSYYDMTVEGKTYGKDVDYTSGYLTNPGKVSVTGHAVDSRSYGGYVGGEITVLPYANPRIQNVTAKRCDKDGNPTDSGTYLKITATRSYHPVISDGVQKNFCSISYRYKTEGASYYSDWVTILDASDLSSDEVVTEPLLEGGLLATSSYRVEVQATDDIGMPATSDEIIIPTDKVYWHRDGARNSFTFGGYVEKANTFAIAAGVNFEVKSLTGETVTISDTGWIDLGLSGSVSVPSDSYTYGRNGPGCYYRVINGNHVYVAFNCACEYAGSTIKVNENPIPSEYAPKYAVFTLLPATSRYIARAIVNGAGQVQINYVQSITTTAQTDTASVAWIDGYIDYFV